MLLMSFFRPLTSVRFALSISHKLRVWICNPAITICYLSPLRLPDEQVLVDNASQTLSRATYIGILFKIDVLEYYNT